MECLLFIIRHHEEYQEHVNIITPHSNLGGRWDLHTQAVDEQPEAQEDCVQYPTAGSMWTPTQSLTASHLRTEVRALLPGPASGGLHFHLF